MPASYYAIALLSTPKRMLICLIGSATLLPMDVLTFAGHSRNFREAFAVVADIDRAFRADSSNIKATKEGEEKQQDKKLDEGWPESIHAR